MPRRIASAPFQGARFTGARMRVAADALRRGSAVEAGLQIRPAILLDPRNPDAMILAALVARAVDRPETAGQLFRRALALRPGDPHAGAGLADLTSDPGPAVDGGAEALLARAGMNPSSPAAWAAVGWSALSSGRPAGAWTALRRACVLAPGDRSGLAMTILAERRRARRVDWLALAGRALAAGPAHPATLEAVLIALREARDGPGIARIGRRLVAVAPEAWGAYQALIAMADAALRSRERATAWRLLARAEAMAPQDIRHAGLQARLWRAEGRTDEAIGALRSRLLQHPDHETSIGLTFDLASMLDQIGDVAGAIRALTMANRAARVRAAADGVDRHRFLGMLERCLPTVGGIVTPAAERGDAPPPAAFLFGMPRSGTTLVGDMLHRHARVEVFDEPELLPDTLRAEADRLGGAGGDLAAIAGGKSLDPASAAAMRDTFGRLLKRQEQFPERPLKVDKSPLGLVYAGLVAQLFPNAATVFVLRHPADVCLSCLMQEFASTDALASFNSVEETAELYDRAMSFWTQSCEVLPLRVHTMRYEALVADPERESRRLTDFLGLDWTPDLLDPRQTAGRYIATPSYRQIEEPINAGALGRWTRYRDYLQPAMPWLAPWIERFGYAES